jgi:site-specific recombinase XerD
MHGVDLTTVASLMGHSTAKVTELYAHLQPDHKKSAVEKLAFKLWG